MLEVLFEDFVKTADVDDELIQKYKDLLPPEMISLWQEHGFGTFHNGYFKVINPDDYQALLESSYCNGDISIPIFATAFGDLLIWEENAYIGIVRYRYEDNDYINKGFYRFEEEILDEELAVDYFTFKEYDEAVKKHGPLEYDECFGYVPLLVLGGSESVNNIKKVKMREHIALIASIIDEI